MAFQAHNPSLDGATKLQDAGSVAASAASTYTYDGGLANAYGKFALVLDVSAIAVATSNVVTVTVQTSDTSGFTSAYPIVEKRLGDHASIGAPTNIDTAANQRMVMYFDNVVCTSATDPGSLIAGRYIRIYFTVAGGGSINCQAWLVPIQ